VDSTFNEPVNEVVNPMMTVFSAAAGGCVAAGACVAACVGASVATGAEVEAGVAWGPQAANTKLAKSITDIKTNSLRFMICSFLCNEYTCMSHDSATIPILQAERKERLKRRSSKIKNP
jgi:hypothetical protein